MFVSVSLSQGKSQGKQAPAIGKVHLALSRQSCGNIRHPLAYKDFRAGPRTKPRHSNIKVFLIGYNSWKIRFRALANLVRAFQKTLG